MREKLQTIGRVKLVGVITFLAVILANVANVLISVFWGFETTWFEDILRATLIPIFLAPLLSWHLVSMFYKLDLLEKDMTLLARTDSLTLTSNRRYFYQQASDWLSDEFNQNRFFAFLILDMDFFKSINDQHGHLCGDKVLETLGCVLIKVAPSPSFVGRLGGEEFALFLPNVKQQDAEVVAAQICQTMRECVIEQDDKKVSCSVSIGISINKNNSKNVIESAFKYADLALYQAKNSGRDCYQVYLPESRH
ncbi:diguanylate cyclase (GGDEF)-like protein [Marinomonas alcarazii]|uniref:diguanylate cyclase n=1 Tax=Marinomonas alcarazii TaxID=491949 RepID=A0A318UWM8_9GAMM|nr:GGDEF domain-containing protein [Marinomonas alcarazii]PYF80942.1 diguanylate cyclase (GGDEF)-like protein [Marinomonas alcarazii]